jgi:hypothetical protein
MEGGAVGHNFEMELPKDYPCQVWFSGFRGKDLNVIIYQNMPNLHNRYKSAERKISQKTLEYIYAKLLIAMQLQLKFEFILVYTKAAMDNRRNFYF